MNEKLKNENEEKEEMISLKKIHDAIPAKLFERSTLRSFLYVLHDFILVLITYLIAKYAIEHIASKFAFTYWPIIIAYWLIQGTIFTGIWILGHECGHQAFSPSRTVNDITGLILHSFLLTPYHAWKISHAQHHRSTGHMTKDMAFVPPTKKAYQAKHRSLLALFNHGLYVTIGYTIIPDHSHAVDLNHSGDNHDDDNNNSNENKNSSDKINYANLIESEPVAAAATDDNNANSVASDVDNQCTINNYKKKQAQEDEEIDNHSMLNEAFSDVPILQILSLIAMLTLGWPSYLLFNIGGQIYGRWASHFTYRSPLFTSEHRDEILISNVGLIVMSVLLFISSNLFTVKSVFIYYFVPYLMVNAWLVLITFLHHTDRRVPHYRDGAWTYVKGALATIDRDYGFIINHLHHHIGDTHVAHHLFSKIPHYNAKAVTEIIKPILGKHYNHDETFFLKSLWNNFLTCHYVPDEGDVLYYEAPVNKFNSKSD